MIQRKFYEELEQVFYHFPKYCKNFLLGDFNHILGRENILKPKIGNESLHQDSNDNGVRIVNFLLLLLTALQPLVGFGLLYE